MTKEFFSRMEKLKKFSDEKFTHENIFVSRKSLEASELLQSIFEHQQIFC
jgi:hypothetical protein